MQSTILIQGFALPRSRSAIQGFALPRSRFAIQGFALPRSRSAIQGFALPRSRSAIQGFALPRPRSAIRAQLESAFGERISTPFTDIERRVIETVPTGIASLDAVTGGLPRGSITEIFGPPSSGSTSAMVSILAQATARDE